VATPPLYLIKRGKVERYCWTEEQRIQIIEELGKGKEDSVHIQRYKGLGEMNAEQLWDTTMNPEKRTLRRITIDNAAMADRISQCLWVMRFLQEGNLLKNTPNTPRLTLN